MGKGLVVLDLVQRLVTHKDYAIEMANSIIKETDLDPITFSTLRWLIVFFFFRHWYR